MQPQTFLEAETPRTSACFICEIFVSHVPATHWYVTVCSWSTSWSTKYQDLDCMSPDTVAAGWYLRVYSNRIFPTHLHRWVSNKWTCSIFFQPTEASILDERHVFKTHLPVSQHSTSPAKIRFQSPSGFPWKPRHVPQCSGVCSGKFRVSWIILQWSLLLGWYYSLFFARNTQD